MMRVVLECRSTAYAAAALGRVADRYLVRSGVRTWSGLMSPPGVASMREAFAALSDDRRMRSSMSVECRDGGSGKLLFSAGRSRTAAHPDCRGSGVSRLLDGIVLLAAVLHDLGKESAPFARMINAAYSGKEVSPQPVRHEWLSGFLLSRMIVRSRAADDRTFLGMLSEPGRASALLDKAWSDAKAEGVSDDPAKVLPDAGSHPVLRAVSFLVMTHHRLIKGDVLPGGIRLSGERHVTSDASGPRRVARGSFAVPASSSRGLMSALAQASARLLEALPSVGGPVLGDLSVLLASFGRTALMLADHRASARRAVRTRKPGKAFANTFDARGSGGRSRACPVPADPLDVHTLKVVAAARGVLRLLREDGMGLRGADRPAAWGDSARLPERFAWQGEAAGRLAALAGGPFLVFLVAGTGTGKTQAAARLLGSVARGPLRITVALGLRPLTLQVGDEYIGKIGFRPDDCAVHIGSEVALALHKADASLTVLEEGPSDPHPQEDDGRIVGGGQEFLPPALEALQEVPERARRAAVPVLVTTVDTISAAADARSGRHLPAMVRIGSSDLVIDEIDGYSPEDVSAICRLVLHAAAFGRNVVVSSATLPLSVATAVHQAWRAGLRAFRGDRGGPMSGSVAWVSDLVPARVIQDDLSLDSVDAARFVALHIEAIGPLLEVLSRQPPRRRRRVLRLGADRNMSLMGGMLAVHQDNHVVSSSGVRVSVGLVRFSRIESARSYALWLLGAARPPKTGIVVCCYHSRFPVSVRFLIERRLSRLLARKSDPDGPDPLLRDPEIERRVNEGGLDDLLVVVVATPILECGRDFDADWAITEPCSMHSLVQLAGRVRRHRPGGWDKENILVMETPWVAGARIAAPGVETKVLAYMSPHRRLLYLKPELADATRNASMLETSGSDGRIDAAPCLDPARNRSPAMDIEEGVRRSVLLGEPYPRHLEFSDVLSHVSVTALGVRPMALLDTAVPDSREFRRKSPDERDLRLFRSAGHGTPGWLRVIEGSGKKPEPSDRLVVPYPSPGRIGWREDVLGIHGGSVPSVDVATAELMSALSLDQSFREDLSSVTFQIPKDEINARISYHDVFGAGREVDG
jgi:CRISPR-associated endonuclease/helicase Cas3